MFKNKNFSILLFGRLITNFGDSIYSIATLTLIYSLTKSTFYSGITLFLISFTAILQIFISPIISKFDVKKFLIISQLIQAIILLVITYLIFINKLHITTLIIFIVCISFINQIVYPIQLGLLPKIVKQQELVKANSLFSIAYQGSDALFNSIGGFIITVFGTIFAFIINSLTFFINSVLFIFLSSDLSKNEKNITTQENYLVIAPKIWTNFGGLFIMKLTDENRIEIYRLKKGGYTYKELSKKFEIDPSNMKYMVKLADLHGETVLIKGKNNYYPPELKLDIINEVLILGHSIKSTSLKYALPNPTLLSNWISKFKENGYNILEKPRGRTSKMKNNNKKIEKNELSKVEQLEKELEYLRAENAVLKKLREIRLKQSQTKKKQK